MRTAPVNRLHTFLTRNLWAQVALSVLGASALVLLISPGESPTAVLIRVAFSSLGGVAVLLAVRLDGALLDAPHLVVPADRCGARYVSAVTGVRLVRPGLPVAAGEERLVSGAG